MKKSIVILSLAWILPAVPVLAGNTNLYEKEEPSLQTFVAKVKLVREAQDGVEVSFDSNVATGYYTLSNRQVKQDDYAKFHALLANRKLTAVKVTAEKEDKIIRSVAAVEKADKAPEKVDLKKDVDAEIDKIMKGN